MGVVTRNIIRMHGIYMYIIIEISRVYKLPYKACYWTHTQTLHAGLHEMPSIFWQLGAFLLSVATDPRSKNHLQARVYRYTSRLVSVSTTG